MTFDRGSKSLAWGLKSSKGSGVIGLRAYGLGFRLERCGSKVQGSGKHSCQLRLGFGVEGLGLRLWGQRLTAWVLGFIYQGLWFRVQDFLTLETAKTPCVGTIFREKGVLSGLRLTVLLGFRVWVWG